MRRWENYASHCQSGDWQLHTNWTDGADSVARMVSVGAERGLSLMVFSEHVRRDMQYDYRSFAQQVREVRTPLEGPIRVLGAEAKVLDVYGRLDISDDVLDQIEILLFSFHTPFFETKSDYTQAVLSAAHDGIADIWAHPTSYTSRYNLGMTEKDWEVLLKDFASSGVAFEINQKYPLPDRYIVDALIELSVPIVFGSDAHAAEQLLTQDRQDQFRALMQGKVGE